MNALVGAVVTGTGLSSAHATSACSSTPTVSSPVPLTVTCSVTAAETLTIPSAAGSVTITAKGAGGGGSDSTYSGQNGGGAGGSGAQVDATLVVGGMTQLTVHVGVGGAGNPRWHADGSQGGDFTVVYRGGGTAPGDALVVAGAGGGASTFVGLDGGNGAYAFTPAGGPGAQVYGGAGASGDGSGAPLNSSWNAGSSWALGGAGGAVHGVLGGGGNGYGGGSSGQYIWSGHGGGGAGGSFVTTTGRVGTPTFAPTGGAGGAGARVGAAGSDGSVTITFNLPTPSLSSVSWSDGSLPVSLVGASGPKAGGGTATITGADFIVQGTTTLTQVSFGSGANAVSCTPTVVSSTEATCALPAYAGTFTNGRALVNVTVTDGVVPDTKTGAFTYLQAPTLTAVSPQAGPLAGTGTLTLTGTGLVSTSSSPWIGMTVSVGGVDCPLASAATATSVTCMLPPGNGAQDVKVTTSAGTSGPKTYSFVAAPTVTGVTGANSSSTPAYVSMSSTTSITITGTDFIRASIGSPVTVTVGTRTCTSVTPASDGQSLTCTVQSGGTAGGAEVTVTAAGGQVTTTNAPVTFASIPGITAPSTGTPAIEVNSTTPGPLTITGSDFGVTQGSVTIGTSGACVVTSWADTSISCMLPTTLADGLYDVKATAASTMVATQPNALRLVTPPAITSITPASVSTASATTITVNGSGFVNGQSTITIGSSTVCGSVNVSSATSLTCSVPAGGTAGPATVTPTTYTVAGSTGSLTYVDPPGVPGTPSATAGAASADVTWTAPSSGGTPDSYTVTSNPAGGSCMVSHPTLTCMVTGLTVGTAYDFTVTATNAVGTSAASGASTPTVTPTAPPVTSSGSGSASATATTATPVAKPSPAVAPIVAPVVTTPVVTAPVAKPVVVRLTGPVVSFAPMSATLGAPTKAALSMLAKKIGKRPARIVVTGYVQPSATTTNDTALSKARAQAVVDYLRGEGVRGTFVARAGGATKQLGPAARRVDIAITYNK